MSFVPFKKSTLAVSCAAALLSAPVVSQVNDDEIEKIEIWSTEVSTSALYQQGDDIARKQADHLSDLLRTIPGVDVGGAHSLNQRLTIRSMGDKDLNITIDGANQNTYMYHHMGNLQIHADILKSVDVEIGTNSIINGGLGGAVRFETKDAADLLKPNQKFGSRVQVAGGDNSGSNVSFTGFGQLTNELDFLAYVNSVSRSDYSVGGNEILDAEGQVIEGTNGEVDGLAGDIFDALIKVGFNIDNQQRVAFSFETYQDKGDYSYRPDMGLATDKAITDSLAVPLLWPTEFTRQTATLKYDLVWGDDSELSATLFNNVSELYRDESGWADNPAYAAWAADVTGEAVNQGFNVIGETSLEFGPDHVLTYGLDFIEYDTDYQAVYSAGAEAAAESSSNFAIYMQDRIELTRKFAVIPGVRYDSFDIDSTLVKYTYDAVSFALAAEYRIHKDFLVKLSGTQLFKGPEMGEVFVGAGLNDAENADIEAETGFNTELAFAYQTDIAGATFSTGLTLFNTDIENYIYDYAPNAEARYWKDNIGDLTIEGSEFYVGYRVNNLNIQLTFSNSDSELDAAAGYQDFDAARLDRQQGDTISGNVSYFFEKYNLKASWEIHDVAAIEAQLALDAASLDNSKDGFTVHNLAVTWNPEALSDLNVLFGIDNVFDEFYASQSSRTGVSLHPRFGDLYLTDYEPGRNVKVTLGYRF